MSAALQRSGTGERTQDASVRAVRLLARFSHTSLDGIAAQERPHSVLHRTNVDGVAPASLRLCSSGIRFCSQHVLPRAWSTRTLMRAPTAHRLPAVLRVEEVRRLLASATPCHNQVSCTTVSSVGLRLHAARALQVAAIDGPRLQGPLHRGTGATDRDGPLPAETLVLRRTSWTTHRHQPWLFPATGRDQRHSPTAPSPLRRPRVQGACRPATHRAGLPNMGVALPPLRPASAPPRLDAGVHPRLIQRSLGHTQLATTMLSLHLTHKGQEDAYARLNTLMQGLLP